MKYEFTEWKREYSGHVLHRIRALIDMPNGVKAGDLGGFIEKESNLSHNGSSWVFDNAYVLENACVEDHACVYGRCLIYGNAIIRNIARIYGDSKVHGNTIVQSSAKVFGDSSVFGDAILEGSEVEVCDSVISGNAHIGTYAKIAKTSDYLVIQGLGSVNRSTTAFRCGDGNIRINCGCFYGTIDKFQKEVIKTHGNNKYAKEYLACIEMIKLHFSI